MCSITDGSPIRTFVVLRRGVCNGVQFSSLCVSCVFLNCFDDEILGFSEEQDFSKSSCS